MLLNFNALINPSFYHGDYFFLNNILDAVLCSAETKMNIHNHYSFEISSCKSSRVADERILRQVSSLHPDPQMKQHQDFYNLVSLLFAVPSHAIASQPASGAQK